MNPLKLVSWKSDSVPFSAARLFAHSQQDFATTLLVASPAANRGLLSKPFNLDSPKGPNVETAYETPYHFFRSFSPPPRTLRI